MRHLGGGRAGLAIAEATETVAGRLPIVPRCSPDLQENSHRTRQRQRTSSGPGRAARRRGRRHGRLSARPTRPPRRPAIRGDRPLGGCVRPRHLRAVEPAMSGAYGEGPMWRMGVTFGVSIMRAACSCHALFASGRHPSRALVSTSAHWPRELGHDPAGPGTHTTAAGVAGELTLESGQKQQRDRHPFALLRWTTDRSAGGLTADLRNRRRKRAYGTALRRCSRRPTRSSDARLASRSQPGERSTALRAGRARRLSAAPHGAKAHRK
jgi:hypothetical protein